MGVDVCVCKNKLWWYVTQCISLGFENNFLNYFVMIIFGLMKSQLIGKDPDAGKD